MTTMKSQHVCGRARKCTLPPKHRFTECLCKFFTDVSCYTHSSLWLNLDQMLAECTEQARKALYLYFVTYELPALISPLLYKRRSEVVSLQSGDSCSWHTIDPTSFLTATQYQASLVFTADSKLSIEPKSSPQSLVYLIFSPRYQSSMLITTQYQVNKQDLQITDWLLPRRCPDPFL